MKKEWENAEIDVIVLEEKDIIITSLDAGEIEERD